MSGPLDGFRVVDLTSAVLGPVATQLLGDMGADVIKVEVPGSDFMRQLGPARHPGMAGEDRGTRASVGGTSITLVTAGKRHG